MTRVVHWGCQKDREMGIQFCDNGHYVSPSKDAPVLPLPPVKDESEGLVPKDQP